MEYLSEETPEFNKLVKAKGTLDNLSRLVIRVSATLQDDSLTDSERECLMGFLKRVSVEFYRINDRVEELKTSSAKESLNWLKNHNC